MWSWLIILYFAHSTVPIDGRQSLPPPAVDPGYICSTYFANQYIECESEICQVRCDVTGGCYNLTINASVSTTLILDCVEERSCQQLLVMAPSSNLEMNCTKAESCDEAHILAQNTYKINVKCSALHACRGIVIEAETVTTEVNLDCISDGACYQSNIQCPITRDAPCNIECSNHTSCQNVHVFINDALDNTLNLRCSNSTECTGVIHCANKHFASSNFIQHPITNALYCDTYNPGCCPFFEGTITCAPGTDCVVDCSETTCVGFNIDATDANSLSLECGAGYGCEKAVIQCPIRNDTGIICDIMCHSCRQILIKPSINTTLSCYGRSSCEHMLLSLDGHLNQFSAECADGYRACYYASVISQHPLEASIDKFVMKCTGIQTCSQMKIDLQMSSVVDGNLSDGFSLLCTGDYACSYLDASFIGNIDKVSIQCGASDYPRSHYRTCYRGVIVHSGALMNSIDVTCEGDGTCNGLDVYLYGEYVGELVWDCINNDTLSTCCACQWIILVSEANVDEMNVTCSGFMTCYGSSFAIGSSATSALATTNRFNLKCLENGADMNNISAVNAACYGADMWVYAAKKISYLDIKCDGGGQGCMEFETKLAGDAVIDHFNMECFDWPYNCYRVDMAISDDAIVSHANVDCNGWGNCMDGIFYEFSPTRTSTEPLQLTYNCNTPHVCEGGEIFGDNLPSTLDITLNCNALDSCKDFGIEDHIGPLSLNCNGTNACNGMTIDCPMMNENACQIGCSTHDASCANMGIWALADTYPFGYLDLDCPSPEIYPNNTACNGITIGCAQNKLNVEYIYDTTAHQYTCSNASDKYCCPWNGWSSNPTHPSSIPTHPSSIPTFNPITTPPSEGPTVRIVYPVTIVIEIEYVMEEIPLELIAQIVDETLHYVLNSSDLIETCEIAGNELRINNTESGIQFGGEILDCLNQAPQVFLITELVSELTTEILYSINTETNLEITAQDITLDIDVINPSSSFTTDEPNWTTQIRANNPVHDTTEIAVSNTIIAATSVLLLLFGCICVCRRYKIKKVKRIEENMQESQVKDDESGNEIHAIEDIIAPGADGMDDDDDDDTTEGKKNIAIVEWLESKETKAGQTTKDTTDTQVQMHVVPTPMDTDKGMADV